MDAKSYIEDEMEIAALLDRLVLAVNAKDIDGVMEAYVPGDSLFVFDLVPPRQYVGTAAYRKDWEDILGMETIDYSINDLAITTDGTLAFSHSINRTGGIGPDGVEYELNARMTYAYRKIEGRWYIVMVHASVPVDPLTGRADFLSKP